MAKQPAQSFLLFLDHLNQLSRILPPTGEQEFIDFEYTFGFILTYSLISPHLGRNDLFHSGNIDISKFLINSWHLR